MQFPNVCEESVRQQDLLPTLASLLDVIEAEENNDGDTLTQSKEAELETDSVDEKNEPPLQQGGEEEGQWRWHKYGEKRLSKDKKNSQLLSLC
jgi:hypothetical protein